MHHASRAASRELIPPESRFGLLLAAPGVMVAPLLVSPSLNTNGDTLYGPMHPRLIQADLAELDCPSNSVDRLVGLSYGGFRYQDFLVRVTRAPTKGNTNNGEVCRKHAILKA